MDYVVETATTAEIMTLAEFKAACRVGHSEQDSLLSELLAAALDTVQLDK